MADDNKDLLRYAAEYSEKQIDLYDMLGVDALTPKDDIHRAWRKRSLKYHPDKAGANFDAAKWELFEHARDILSDDNARATYDQSMKAKLLRKQERDAMDKERKKFADDLEARENAARQQQMHLDQQAREMMQKERARLAEQQRMRDEELKRQEQAAEEMDDMAEARRRVEERKKEKAKRKQAKDAMKAASNKKTRGPANGVVMVPGDFLVDIGTEQRKYWELVCDKLRAIQAVRDLQKAEATTPEALEAAEQNELLARNRIHEAEMMFQRQATT